MSYMKVTAILIASLLFLNQSFAASGPKLSLYGGVASIQHPKNHLDYSTDETDALKGGKRKNHGEGGAGIAYNFLFAPEDPNTQYIIHSLSLGIDAFYWQGNRDGIVFVAEDPSFPDYFYHIDLKSMSYLLNAEVNFHSFWGIMPFIEAGAGLAHNKARYHDLPRPPTTFFQLSLNNSEKNNFAYDVGAGLKIDIIKNLEISLRYLYANLGHAKTSKQGTSFDPPGVVDPITIAEPVSVRLWTQSLWFGVSYLIN